MMRKNPKTQKNEDDDEHRASIESAMTFMGLQMDSVLEGQELVDTLQYTRTNTFDTSLGSISIHDEKERRNNFLGETIVDMFDGEKLGQTFQSTTGTSTSSHCNRRDFVGDGTQKIKSKPIFRESQGLIVPKTNQLEPSPPTMFFSPQNTVHNSNIGGETLGQTFQSYQQRALVTGPAMNNHYSRRDFVEDGGMIERDTQIITTKPIFRESQQKIASNTNQLKPSPPTMYFSPQNTVNNSNRRNYNSSDDDDEEEDRIEYIDPPQPYDIICGRNNGAHNCVGNCRFRVTIMMNLNRYMAATSRDEKTIVIKSTIAQLYQADARFIKKVGNGKYIHLKKKQIREKVGHAFREMISMSEKERPVSEGNPNFLR